MRGGGGTLAEMTNDGKLGSAWTGGQWSFVRVVFAAAFLAGTIVSTAVLVREFGLKTVPPFAVQIVAAGLVLVGAWTRFAALLLLGFRATRALTADFIDPGFELAVGLPLLLLVLAPPAPFGSFETRGRVDPDGGWRLPPWSVALAWIATGLTGLVVSFGAFWTMRRSESPASSASASSAAVVVLIVAGFAFAALAPFRTTRRYAWCALWLGQVGSCFFDTRPDFMAIRLALPLFLFDPAWLPPRRTPAPELVFFDGHCGLCHRLVRFVLGEDRERLFLFSTLQGEKIKTVLDEATRARLPDSVVVQDSQRRVRVKSAAVVHVYDRLGGIWRVVALLLRAIPTALRDLGYESIAAVRYRLFPRPAESCPLMPPRLKDRFVA